MYKLLNSEWYRKVIQALCVFLGVFNKIVPKSKNKILIFDSKEVYLNNYAMYRYLIENGFNRNYTIYFSMPNAKETLGPAPENVKYISGLLKTAWVFLFSSICFLDASSIRIKPSKKQEVLNLWHGTPLKCIGFMSHSANKHLPKRQMNSFSHIAISHESFKDIYIKSFNLNENQLAVLGQPRLDSLFANKNTLNAIGVDASKYKKVIMWMTTYRVSYDKRLMHTSNENWSDTNLPIITDMEKVSRLNDELAKENIFLLIKIHQGSVFDKECIKPLSNIKVIRDRDFIPKGIQLYEILSECHGLITDYSSVYFDYLLLNRPIGFITDDIEEYARINGFVFDDPLSMMPGEKINDMDELNQFLHNTFIDGKDGYEDERKRVLQCTNAYIGNDNCRRALDFAVENTEK